MSKDRLTADYIVFEGLAESFAAELLGEEVARHTQQDNREDPSDSPCGEGVRHSQITFILPSLPDEGVQARSLLQEVELVLLLPPLQLALKESQLIGIEDATQSCDGIVEDIKYQYPVEMRLAPG